MRAVFQPPGQHPASSMVSVVLAPRAVSSLARPMRPECPVIRPSMPAPLAPSRCGAVLAFPRLVHLVGALACPLAAGASAVPGGAELVGHLRP